MLHLSSTDRDQIKQAREAGALKEIQHHRIEDPAGTIFVACPDGDQFRDVYGHHCTLCAIERHHPLSLNGGALLLSRHSPILCAKKDGAVFLRHVKAASRLKGMRTVVLYVHAPCGVAYGSKLDFWEVLRLLVEAKLRLRHQRGLRKLKIACFVHVDYNGNALAAGIKKRTYFVDRAVASEFLKTQGREVRIRV